MACSTLASTQNPAAPTRPKRRKAGSIRQDLEVVLEAGAPADTGFSPAERTMLKNVLALRGRRVEDVLDCWFESGSMPVAQQHYPFDHKEAFDLGFPADYIGEGLDQTHLWFYVIHVLSTIAFEKPAYRNVLVNGAPGVVTFADGEPYAVLGFTVARGKIVEINVLADRDRLRRLDLTFLAR